MKRIKTEPASIIIDPDDPEYVEFLEWKKGKNPKNLKRNPTS
jgi:hypothetical protein